MFGRFKTKAEALEAWPLLRDKDQATIVMLLLMTGNSNAESDKDFADACRIVLAGGDKPSHGSHS